MTSYSASVRRFARFALVCLLLSVLGVQGALAATRVLYVKAGAPSAGANGQSWATAYSELSTALTAVDSLSPVPSEANPVEIWITAGTYKPDPTGLSDFQAATFSLRNWTRIIGGFSASSPEATVGARSPLTPLPILSGDLLNPPQAFITPTSRLAAESTAIPDPQDPGFYSNCYTVVTAKNVVGAVLDSVVVSGGYAWNQLTYSDTDIQEMAIASDVTPANGGGLKKIVPDVAGGGIYVENVTRALTGWNLALNNVLVTQNFARGFGGGLATIRSTVLIGNSDFVANLANCDGGGFWSRESVSTFQDVRLLRNEASGSGGAVHLESPVRLPDDWASNPAAGLFGMSPEDMGKLVDTSIKAYKLARFAYLTATIGFFNAFKTMATPSNLAGGVYSVVTAIALAVEGGVWIARQFGDDSAFTRYWTNEFYPNFNKYATPGGLVTLAAEWVSGTQALDLYDMKVAFRSVQNEAPPTVFLGCEFRLNKAGTEGGAIYASRDNLHVERCRILSNTALGNGGAIAQNSFNSAAIFSTVIRGNTSPLHSAILFSGIVNARLVNNTIVDNVSTGAEGFAVSTEAGSTTLLYNSILWGNTNTHPNNLAGGADLNTPNKARLPADRLKDYNDSGATSFRFIGVVDTAYCNIESLNRIPDDWNSSHVRLYTRSENAVANFLERLYGIAGAFPVTGDALERLNKYCAYELFNVLLTGEGNRVTDRHNISQDPLLHSGYIPGLGSPVADAGLTTLFQSYPQPLDDADVLEQPRVVGAQISIGAVEQSGLPVTETGAIAGRIFVRPTATGNGSGTDWNNATADLKTALAQTNSEVWVAAGTYYPSSDGTRTASFVLGDGTRAYGGFQGVEIALSERSVAAFKSILSGDLSVRSPGAQPSYHVVRQENRIATVTLDGFTITGGLANGSADEDKQGGGIYAVDAPITLRNCTVRENRAIGSGGGVYARSTDRTKARFTNLLDTTFESNEATVGGGAFVVGEVSVDRCTFTSNGTSREGAALYLEPVSPSQSWYILGNVRNSVFNGNYSVGFDTDPNITGTLDTRLHWTFVRNCTFYANTTTNVVRVSSNGELTLDNSILYNNGGYMLQVPSTEKQQVKRVNARATVKYSVIQNAVEFLLYDDHNLDVNPGFVNAGAGNFRLNSNSPLVNAGNATYDPIYPTDRDGNPRVYGAALDIGAYELQASGSHIPGSVRIARTIAADGPVYTFTLVTTSPLASTGLSYVWRVNKGDGSGSRRVTDDPAIAARVSGLNTPVLTVTMPPSEWEGWVFMVEVLGSTPSVGYKALTGIRTDRLYVNAAATGTGDGLSWANAYTTLETAIANAGTYSEIWVAKGTYKPSATGATNATYLLRPGLEIFGGFAGTESKRGDRNVAVNTTILSGAYSTPAVSAKSASYLVSVALHNGDNTLPCRVDGFTLTGARSAALNVAGSVPFTLANTIIDNPVGSGAYLLSGANVAINDSTFRRAANGALRVYGNSTATIERTFFVQNQGNRGAAIEAQNSTVTLNRATIADNLAASSPGGIYALNSTVTIGRSVLWGNRDRASDATTNFEATQVAADGSGTVAITNSIVESATTYANNGNLALHPLFVDPSVLNYTVFGQSPTTELNAGAQLYAGTPQTVLRFTALPSSRTDRLSPTSVQFTATWPTAQTYYIEWQVDRGGGWVTPAAASLTANADNTSNGRSTVTFTNGGSILPTFRVRAIA